MPVYQIGRQAIKPTKASEIARGLQAYAAAKKDREDRELQRRAIDAQIKLDEARTTAAGREGSPSPSKFKVLTVMGQDGKFHSVVYDITTGQVIKDLGPAPPKEVKPSGGDETAQIKRWQAIKNDAILNQEKDLEILADKRLREFTSGNANKTPPKSKKQTKSKKQKLDDETAATIWDVAGGDRKLAERLAELAGFEW